MNYQIVDVGISGMAVAFTGHREYPNVAWTHDRLLDLVYDLHKKGFTAFISGGALGVDQAAAYAVLTLKEQHEAELIIAKPFDGQENRWPADHREKYRELLQQADRVVSVSLGEYAMHKFHIRDRWMVDRANALVGVWDGRTAGGTYGTLKYARKSKIPVCLINPKEKTVSEFEPLRKL